MTTTTAKPGPAPAETSDTESARVKTEGTAEVWPRRNLLLAVIITGVLGVFGSTRDLQGCTGIMLTNVDASIVHGRTLEFGMEIKSNIAVIPRGYRFVGKTPRGDGITYEAKYAVVGLRTFKDQGVQDGLNEAGLAAGAFYFPTFTQYTEVTPKNQAKAMSATDFPNWILTQFATVGEVRAAIEAGVAVVGPTVVPGWGPTAPPLHYIVYDKTGASLVIEPVGGKLVMHDNPIGVLTNSPPFEWHMINLRNYIALSPRNVPPVKIDGITLQQLGQGGGMLGLPGDFTPPSRFVRAAVFSTTAIPSRDAEEGVKQVFHILNQFDIPVGVARNVEKDGTILSDYTQVTMVRDPQALRYYYRTYDDQTIRMVDLRKFDLNAKELKQVSTLQGTTPIVDMSSSTW
jgi:choloylglycine hydrolase